MSLGNAPSPSAGGNIKFCGILTILLGVVSLLAPLLVGMSIVVFVGILVLLAGLFRIFGALAFYKLEQGLFSLLLGGLTLVCGLIMVTDPLFASGVITVVLVIYLLLDGMLEVGGALRIRPAPGWGWMLSGGALSLLLGILLWNQYPLSGALAIGILFGLKMLLIGTMMLALGKRVTFLQEQRLPEE